jgi:hypothetical protein
MLRLVTGKPGSGKSYYAVSYLTKQYCEFDHISNEWVLKPDYLVISNIDNLRVDHWNLQKLIDDKGLENIFSVDFVEPLAKQYKRIIFIVDECQRYFPAKLETKLPNSVWFFFEYHRHYGIDLILCSQHASSVSRRIVNIAETYIEAAPQTLRLGSYFRYSLVDVTTGDKLSRSVIKPDPRVYLAYRSANVDTGLERPKSYATRIAILGIVGVSAGLYAMVYVAKNVIGGAGSVSNTHSVAKSARQSSSPVPSSVPSSSRTSVPVPRSSSSPSSAYISSPPAPLTVSELLVFSASGISVSDIARFPSVCRVTGSYLRCPHVFPVQYYYGASNIICRNGRANCVSLFKIRDSSISAASSTVSSGSVTVPSNPQPATQLATQPASQPASPSTQSASLFQPPISSVSTFESVISMR